MSIDMDIALSRVLIVDDDSSSVILLRLMLNRYWSDLHVLDAPDARTALRLIEQAPPRLIFVDAYLPDMDTFDFIQSIRADYPETAIITLLAYAHDKTLQRYQTLCDEVFTSPLHFTSFIATIDRYLTSSSQLSEVNR